MAGNKTVETQGDVSVFVRSVADEEQRADAATIITLLSKISGHPPKMWGPSIIGFGSYHYHYESGREGDMCRIGFSPRKGQTVLYFITGFPTHAEIIDRLGKVKTGKSCLYVKRLADIDLVVLEELARASWAEMARRYPD